MDEVRRKLEELIQDRGCNYASVSRLLGRNAAYIQQFIRRGTPRRLEKSDVEVLARFFGVEPIVLGGQPTPAEQSDDLVQVPVLDVTASAGHGAITGAEQQTTRIGFDENWLRGVTSSRSANLSIIRVHGDSMEPMLLHGDEVMVDLADGPARLRDGIYVLRMDDALSVKRIALEPQGRKISVVSDNQAYPSWHGLDRRVVNFVGRVVWFGRKVQ
ncbi:S24 family peptidase [Novosphingobium percolationis]|uniref:S24 family peptidase n=1 Tax=Novosphingobium percolationis TaxID=2871811 RepID=UPI001CD1CCBE|nr:S24 family peptidase [Novosphingobium percolationis]